MSESNQTELHIAEVGALRAELNSTVDRMSQNENFCMGLISGIYAFILSNDHGAISAILSILSIVVSLLGSVRYFQLRRHTFDLDRYLKKIELEIQPIGGWTNFYYREVLNAKFGGDSKSRIAFWLILGIVSFAGCVYVIWSVVADFP